MVVYTQACGDHILLWLWSWVPRITLHVGSRGQANVCNLVDARQVLVALSCLLVVVFFLIMIKLTLYQQNLDCLLSFLLDSHKFQIVYLHHSHHLWLCIIFRHCWLNDLDFSYFDAFWGILKVASPFALLAVSKMGWECSDEAIFYSSCNKAWQAEGAISAFFSLFTPVEWHWSMDQHLKTIELLYVWFKDWMGYRAGFLVYVKRPFFPN